MKKHTILALGIGALFVGSASAGTKEVVVPVEPKTFCDHYGDLFNFAKLYRGDGFITEIDLEGRYQGQWHDTSSDLGDDAGWEHRRFRLGGEIKFADNFEFEFQFNLNPEAHQGGRFVEDLNDSVIKYSNDDIKIAVGKKRPGFTREFSTSTKYIKTIERSQLANQIAPDHVGAAYVTLNDVAGFEITVGGLSGALTDDEDYGLPEFNGGYGIFVGIARDLTESTTAHLNYLYNDGDEGNNGFEDYENIVVLGSQNDWDRLHLLTDVIYATGLQDTSDVFGVVVMPYYDITDQLEAVFRYTYSSADDADGLNVQSRYERAAAGRLNGDEYHAFYGGINWYICDDKLKIMNGLEYSTLSGADNNDYWTFFSGIRLFF